MWSLLMKSRAILMGILKSITIAVGTRILSEKHQILGKL